MTDKEWENRIDGLLEDILNDEDFKNLFSPLPKEESLKLMEMFLDLCRYTLQKGKRKLYNKSLISLVKCILLHNSLSDMISKFEKFKEGEKND